MPGRESSRRDGSSRERIDAAALRLLALHGYEGLSLQAIADEVRLHKSTLFHHYKNKAEIVDSVVHQVMSRIAERVIPHTKGDAPSLDDIVALTGELVEYFAREPAAAKVLFRVILSPQESPMSVNMKEGHPFVALLLALTDWFQRARKQGVIRHVRIRHVLMDLIGVVVFYPAAAEQMLYLTGPTPFDADEVTKRKREVAVFVRRALAPDPN